MILCKVKVMDKREFLQTTPQGSSTAPTRLVTFDKLGSHYVTPEQFEEIVAGEEYSVYLIKDGENHA